MKKDIKEALKKNDKKTLYVSRAVKNAEEIISWAKSQGFKDVVEPKNMHVTLAHSSEPVDWSLLDEDGKEMTIKGGNRSVEPLGDKGAVVLKFSSKELSSRFKEIMGIGASWDYSGYQPHVTISYNGEGVDTKSMKPFEGSIVLEGETRNEVDEDWVEDNEKDGEKEESVSHSIEETLEKSEATSLDYDEGAPLNMVWFTFDGIGLPIAKKLIDEGNNVIIAQIQSKKDLGDDGEEDSEAKKRRLSLYDGILDKQDAMKVLKQMKNVKDKNNWIVFFDFNSMGALAEKALALGFTKGLFPLLKDAELEKDRDAAKDIVKKHYPDLTVAEVNEFSKVEEGIKFLEETEQLWVLKGNGENAKTLVPQNDDPELAKRILIDALQAHKANYEEDGGFILEEKIVGGFEATPQIVFLDGKVVFTDVDIENKNVGSGNLSVQTGAMQTLVVKSKLKDKINDIAFPDWVYKRAKEHTGLFITDAGLICKDGKYYFTEFCFQRFGYDSFFAEIDMAGSATDFFANVFSGKDPLVSDFGVAVRGMNMHKGDKDRRVLEGVSMTTEDHDHTFIFECKAEEDKYVCTGCGWDLVVFTGAADTLNEAVERAYECSDKFAFEDLYVRPKFDFMSFDYLSSIPNRFLKLNGELFKAKQMEELGVYEGKKKLRELEDSIKEALNEQEEA